MRPSNLGSRPILTIIKLATLTVPMLVASFNAFAQEPTSKAAAPSTNTSNVNVVNTPTVNIGTSTTALQVKDVDNAARQPFQKNVPVQLGPGVSGDSHFFQVPAGKRLVIEQLTALFTIPAASGQIPLAEIDSSAGGNVGFALLTSTFIGRTGSFDRSAATIPVRMYADPGTSVALGFSRSPDLAGQLNGTASASISITGYFVNVP